VTYTDESLPALLRSLTSAIERLGAIGAVAPDLSQTRPTLR
jgi:hypothetical protein